MTQIRMIVSGVALFLGIIMLFAFWPFVSVNAGHRGVLVVFGQVNPVSLAEGFHMVNPLAHVIEIDTRLQKAEAKGEAASKDLQSVHTTLAINFLLTSDSVPALYREVGMDYEIKVIDPIVQDRFKAVTAQYTAEQLITHREEVRQKVKKQVIDGVQDRMPTIRIQDVLITNFDFSPQFNAAIEQKQVAEQQALKAERDLQRIKVEAEQRIAQAKAEAEAIRIQAQSISAQGGEEYVRLKWVEKWNGTLPTTTLGNATPLISIK